MKFYETKYSQGAVSDVPSASALAELMSSNFAGTSQHYGSYIDVLLQIGLKPGDRIFDYGCSWGYGSYQMRKAGFDAVSFEVARGRSEYAQEKLGVSTIADMNSMPPELASSFDCFFSAHVLEHVPSPNKSFEYAMTLLKPGGLFVSFTPNGSRPHRSTRPLEWSKLWGEVHPNFIDDMFLNHAFALSPRAIGSTPVFDGAPPQQSVLRTLNNMQGSELFFAARKVSLSWA